MGSGPRIPKPPKIKPPPPASGADEAAAAELARKRREANRRRIGRTGLRIDQPINTAPNGTGLNIP